MYIAAFPHYCMDPDVTLENMLGSAHGMCIIRRICNWCTGYVAMTIYTYVYNTIGRAAMQTRTDRPLCYLDNSQSSSIKPCTEREMLASALHGTRSGYSFQCCRIYIATPSMNSNKFHQYYADNIPVSMFHIFVYFDLRDN